MKRLETPGQLRPVGHLQSRAEAPYFFPVPFRPAVAPVSCLANGEAAGAAFGFSFFGFLASRLPRCSPLAIGSFSSSGSVQHPTIPSAARGFPAPYGNAHKLSETGNGTANPTCNHRRRTQAAQRIPILTLLDWKWSWTETAERPNERSYGWSLSCG